MKRVYRFIFKCLAMLFIVLLVLFELKPGAPTSASLTTVTEEYDGVRTSSFVDVSGKITFAVDKGYASVRTTYNEVGKKVLEEYLGTDGEALTIPAGYSATRWYYSNGLATEIMYLGEDGQPVILKNGYSSIHRTYNDAHRADTDTYYAVAQDGTEIQVERKEGYWQYRRGYTGKYVTEISYLDHEGLPVNIKEGYARINRVYDLDTGKILQEKYYDASDMPVASSYNGSYGYEREYDDLGRVVRQTYLGPDGSPWNIKKGYATIITSYLTPEPDGGEDNGNVSIKREYFDQNGERATIGRFQYGTQTDPAGIAVYLDSDGEPVFRLDNFLLTHPLFVLVSAILLTFLTLTIKGRPRTVFLILYLFFILFITMMYRETGNSRAQLELFWSYRQFLSNSRMRYEILNNIWLFVPFGASIGTYAAEKKRYQYVLIPVLLSALIEVLQYLLGIGLCELDDVISNSLGGIAGFALAGFRRKLIFDFDAETEGDEDG